MINEEVDKILSNRISNFNLLDIIEEHSNEYKIKSKRAVVTYPDYTHKIPFSDFFKARVIKEDDDWSFECFSKAEDSVDIMLFAIIGLVSILSKLGVCESNSSGNNVTGMYLEDLRSYIICSYPLINDLNDFTYFEDSINNILMLNDEPISTIEKRVKNCKSKSMYLASALAMSELKANLGTLDSCYAYLLLLSQCENAEVVLADIFLRYLPVLSMGGVIAFPALKNMVETSKDLIESMIKWNNVNKFPYKSFKLRNNLTVTDVEGFSILLVTQMAVSLFDNTFRVEDFKDSEYNFKPFYKTVLGDDTIVNYLLTGSPMRHIKFTLNPKTYKMDLGDSVFNFSSSNLWGICDFVKDIDALGLSLNKFMFSSALTQDYFNRSLIFAVLLLFIRRGKTNLIKMAIDDVNKERDSLNKEFEKYKKNNLILSNNNRRLGRQVKSLQSEIESLKASNENENIKTSLEYDFNSQNVKIESLVAKVQELEEKIKLQEEGMSDLLKSLELDDEVDTNEVDKDELIKFLNGFSLVFIGGRSELTSKLEELGLRNFTQVSSLSDVSRLGNFDFMISMTRFNSHKLFYGALSKLGSDNKDKHMYFNGTNLDSLLYSCYAFITKYFEL